jgi:hypothetical protein
VDLHSTSFDRPRSATSQFESAGMPTRNVYCEDALPWLAARQPLAECSFITSLPDLAEISGSTLAEWLGWFDHAAKLVLRACPDEGVAIFYQSDIKHEGRWIDKGYLCQKAAEATGHALLWHKVVCRKPPGTITFGRPSYSHMLCFARELRDEPARSTADVLPDRGAVTWAKGMGLEASRVACAYVREHTSTRTVVDPFCGEGQVLAVANAMELDAIGVELGANRARRARALDRRESVPGRSR